MRWIKKTGVKLFRLSFRLTDPVEEVKFLDWMIQSKKSSFSPGSSSRKISSRKSQSKKIESKIPSSTL